MTHQTIPKQTNTKPLPHRFIGVILLYTESRIDRQHILDKLHDHLDEMTQRFDVASLGVFGSLSRDEAAGDSDVDILVDFRHQATFRGYFALKFYLEELLDHPVDLVTRQALKERLRPYIERDLIHVA